MTEALTGHLPPQGGTPPTPRDPSEPLPLLRRALGTGADGLSTREAERRLAVTARHRLLHQPAAPRRHRL